ncbi:hypothetical protein ACXHQL_23535 [Vibrio parahaemolyticus]|uniref:hypothetical protein n=1 Tax=Vibrio parahaemolyticus TaxID=670 RepID=UPI001D16C040|nr:hypothetical protein [Vibrio parahaemolyticus]MCC3798407.1 hypothetical protein [Vibrio parahaemolyticus]MCC3813209.1 hypothetical protein [Vibrio parahaemolyticus]
MLELIANSDHITGLIAIVTIIQWFGGTKIIKNYLGAITNIASDSSSVNEVVAPVDSSKKPNSPHFFTLGTLIVPVEDMYGEEKHHHVMLSVLFSVTLLFVFPFAYLCTVNFGTNLISSALSIITLILSPYLIMKLASRQFFIFLNKSGNVWYFNRGFFSKCQTVYIDLHADQSGKESWTPYLLINGLKALQAEPVPSKAEAQETFRKEGKSLANTYACSVRKTSWMWNDIAYKYDAIKGKLNHFIAKYRRQ